MTPLAYELLVPLVFGTGLILAFLREGVALAEGCPCHCGHAVHKLGLEQDIGVAEHAILQGHHHKLEREQYGGLQYRKPMNQQ